MCWWSPLSKRPTCTTTGSEFQHQTSRGRCWTLCFSDTRSKMWGVILRQMKKMVTICCLSHLAIACMLHHTLFHDITAHLWWQTGSQLWCSMKQQEDKFSLGAHNIAILLPFKTTRRLFWESAVINFKTPLRIMKPIPYKVRVFFQEWRKKKWHLNSVCNIALFSRGCLHQLQSEH